MAGGSYNVAMKRTALAAFVAAALMPVVRSAPEPPPEPPPAAPTEAPAAQEKPKRAPIYDEQADARKQISAALARARAENRRVLIEWGANWCPWCHLLQETFRNDKDVKKKLLYEYDVVLVDVGRSDKNLDLAAGYGADFKTQGLPFLTILSADGKVLVNQETGSLEKGQAHDPAKVLTFLEKHQAPHLSADAVLADGLSRATRESKRVFLHFGAPWCGWCRRLDDWLARPEVSAILGRALVDVKIDTERMIGGQEILDRFAKEKTGIPWYAVLGADGAVIVTSGGKGGNIGFPWEPREIDRFGRLLEQGAPGLASSDIEALLESLADTRAEIEGRQGSQKKK